MSCANVMNNRSLREKSHMLMVVLGYLNQCQENQKQTARRTLFHNRNHLIGEKKFRKSLPKRVLFGIKKVLCPGENMGRTKTKPSNEMNNFKKQSKF